MMKFFCKDQCHEAVNCPICAGNSTIIDLVGTIHPNSMSKCALRQCAYCNHWWIDPMPDQTYLQHLYADNSEFVVPKGWAEFVINQGVNVESVRHYAQKVLDVSKQQQGFNYLEVGCGNGHLLNYFSQYSSICYGVEPGHWKPSVHNIVQNITDIPKDIQFDVIIVQDVLEHLTDPIEMLSTLHSMANKGCTIAGGFPNNESILAQTYRGAWRMVRPLGHLHYFSAESAIKTISKSNWKVTFLSNCSPNKSITLEEKDQWYFQATCM